MIKMVIFDMAGTTIEEDNLVYKMVQKALRDFDCSADLNTVLSIAAGKEKRQALQNVYQHIRGEAPEEALLYQIYRHFEELLETAYDEHELKLFDGVLGVLESLKERGITRIFNTGYTEDVAEKILQKVDIKEGREIEELITADMVPHSRPAPDMIQLAMKNWQCTPDQVIKIGDSKVDIEEGKNAGVRFTIGITTGAQQREELAEAEPDFIIDSIEDLLKYV